MFEIIVDGKKFLELKREERDYDVLNKELEVKVGDIIYYSTYDEYLNCLYELVIPHYNLHNGKLVKKFVGDIKEMSNGKVRVKFVKGVK